MLIARSAEAARGNPGCPSTDEWGQSVGDAHSAALLSLSKEGISDTATAWTKFEDFVLSKISQSQEDKYRMVPLE